MTKRLINVTRRGAKAALPRKYRPLARRLYRPVLGALWHGDSVECPCCGGRFRRFLRAYSVNGPSRPNAGCPGCGSGERHRLLWLYFQDKLRVGASPLRLLHFAPEGFFQDHFTSLPNVEYVSADLDSPLAMANVDITDLPFDDESFDLILCSHVLEHIPDDRRAMSELFRVLRPGGKALLMCPIDWNRGQTFEDPSLTSAHERELAFGQDDHVRIYGRDFADRLAEAGFGVEVDGYVTELPDEVVRRHGLRRDHRIFVGTRVTAFESTRMREASPTAP